MSNIKGKSKFIILTLFIISFISLVSVIIIQLNTNRINKELESINSEIRVLNLELEGLTDPFEIAWHPAQRIINDLRRQENRSDTSLTYLNLLKIGLSITSVLTVFRGVAIYIETDKQRRIEIIQYNTKSKT